MSHSAHIIDGKVLAAQLRAKVQQAVTQLQAHHHVRPSLHVVLVGEDPASRVYVASKEKLAQEVGFVSVAHRLPADTGEADRLALIAQLNHDPEVDGILVQLPVPKHINSAAIIDAIDPAKDVDGFHYINVAALAANRPALVPCTPLGCMMLLKQQLGALAGLHAVVVGRSAIVGRPMAQLLVNADCTVTIVHSKTRDLPAEIRRADIVIAAVGRPDFIQGDWLKAGACVIDVGINRLPSGKLTGDVDFASALSVAGSLTPVPGGVGPMTIACLLANTLTAALVRRKITDISPVTL